MEHDNFGKILGVVVRRGTMKVFKLRAWGFFHKLNPLLFTAFYFMLTVRDISPLEFFLLVISIVSYGIFAITLNDFFDRPFDLRAGKRTGIENFSDKYLVLILLTSSFLCLFLAYFLAGLSSFIYLVGMAVTSLYSHPRTRMKRRGIAGPVFNSLAELSPACFITTFFGSFNLPAFVFLSLYFFVSLVDILNHQLEDYWSDLESGLRTFAVENPLRAQRYLRILSVVSVFLFFLFSLFLLEVPGFWWLFLALVSFYVVDVFLSARHRSIHSTSLQLPVYFVDFINIGLFNILTLYFSFLLFCHNPYHLSVFLFSLFCSAKFVLKVMKRIRYLG